jgi:hypothetical protein
MERDGDLPLDGAPAEPARGPGRPKGSGNKRARAWQAWIDASGKHPIEFLAGVFRAKPGELLGVIGPEGAVVLQTKDELALKIRAAEALLPYVEQKLPQVDEDDAKGDRRIVMVVGTVSGEQQAQMARAGLHFAIKQNQGVIEHEPAKSDGEQSDDEPNLLTFNGDRSDDH